MKLITFLSLLFISAIVMAEDETEHVLVLTQDNFEDTINTNDYVLVEFYAPWCGHCKALAPEYEKAAKMLSESGSDVKLGKVDATVHTDLATKFKVQGYPTLKFFKKGSEVEYTGPRKADGIVNWINKKLGPALNHVKSMDELNKLKEKSEMLAVFFSKDEKASTHRKVVEVANKIDEVAFVLITDDAIASELGLSGTHKLLVFKKFDDPKVEYSGEWEEEDIKKFIKLEQVPLVTEFSQETAHNVFDSHIKTHIISFSGTKTSDYAKHMEIMKEAAIAVKGDCHAVIIDMDDEESARVGEFFGVSASDVPTFRVIKLQDDMVKFQPDQKDFTAQYIIKFAKDVLEGKVKPHLKSAEEPEDWDKSPVKVFVAKTFHERAVNKDKAVFVEFYAPWCGHCKALTPIWDELGEHYKDSTEVIVAKCDGTENEVEDLKVNSFPTLKFSPKGSTEFVDYKGERTKEEFIKFIDSNGKASDKKKKDGDKHDEL